uniref:Putative secreted peptide n=1 Tax=Anopheles braziliensis TaxID=58242 RepID=A0A2M3ZNZ4_9DIPT
MLLMMGWRPVLGIETREIPAPFWCAFCAYTTTILPELRGTSSTCSHHLQLWHHPEPRRPSWVSHCPVRSWPASQAHNGLPRLAIPANWHHCRDTFGAVPS